MSFTLIKSCGTLDSSVDTAIIYPFLNSPATVSRRVSKNRSREAVVLS
jgi:hypothetical protein